MTKMSIKRNNVFSVFQRSNGKICLFKAEMISALSKELMTKISVKTAMSSVSYNKIMAKISLKEGSSSESSTQLMAKLSF